jgi:hypothetical protein
MSKEKNKKDKKERVKLKDRKIFQWCKENAPELLGNTLEFVGDITGIEIVEKLGEKISGSNDLTSEQKAEAAEIIKLEYERDKESEKEVTERWKADMSSDSWLSKNTRPIVLLSAMLMLYIFITLDSFKIAFEIKESWISLYEIVLLTAIGGYFGARTWEKIRRK